MTNDRDPYRMGIEFAALFARFEFALKRSGYLKKGRSDAQADWAAYAHALGSEFFDHIESNRLAPTLLSDPPRKLMADGLSWAPKDPPALANVDDLFIKGVCRVRNSYMHGEKFVGGPHAEQFQRDADLLQDALTILREAEPREGNVAVLIKKYSSS